MLDDDQLASGLSRLGLNIEGDMIERIKSMGGKTSLEAMARVGLQRDAPPRLESSDIPSVPTRNSSQSNHARDAMKMKPSDKTVHPLKVQLAVENGRPNPRLRQPPSPIKRQVPIETTTQPGIRQDYSLIERCHDYPASMQSTKNYRVCETAPSGDDRPNRKHFHETDHLNTATELVEADDAYNRPNRKHYMKTNQLDEGIPCPAEPSHVVGERRRGNYGHRKGLVITSNCDSHDDDNKLDTRAERRHEPVPSGGASKAAGVKSSRAVQSLKNIHEQYGVEPSFSAVRCFVFLFFLFVTSVLASCGCVCFRYPKSIGDAVDQTKM